MTKVASVACSQPVCHGPQFHAPSALAHSLFTVTKGVDAPAILAGGASALLVCPGRQGGEPELQSTAGVLAPSGVCTELRQGRHSFLSPKAPEHLTFQKPGT